MSWKVRILTAAAVAWLGFIAYMQVTTWEDTQASARTPSERMADTCSSLADEHNLTAEPSGPWQSSDDEAARSLAAYSDAAQRYAQIGESMRRTAALDPALLEENPQWFAQRDAALGDMKALCGIAD